MLVWLILLAFPIIGYSAPQDEDGAKKAHGNSNAFTPAGKRVAEWLKYPIGNPEELGGRFEGDIEEDPNRQPPRNGLRDPRFRWPRGVIPYVITGRFSPQNLETITRAFVTYATYTCIRFRPRRPRDADFINIRSNNDGCWSSVGRNGGQQIVNLQNPGCTGFGTVLHELLHAIGFYHEQSRTDRDQWVTIMWQNIQEGQAHNFVRYDANTITDFGVPYDYHSIMHYSWNAFSKDPSRLATIVPTRQNVTLGQRDNLTRNDVRKVNLMYSCRKGRINDDIDLESE